LSPLVFSLLCVLASVVSSVIVTLVVVQRPIRVYRRAFDENTKVMSIFIRELAEGRRPSAPKLHRPEKGRRSRSYRDED